MPSPTATRDLVDQHLARAQVDLPELGFDRYTLVEMFTVKPGLIGDVLNAAEAVRMIANRDFMLSGTNAVSASTALAPGGGFTMETAGADNDQAILNPHTTANMSAWHEALFTTDFEPIFEMIFEPPAAIGAADAMSLLWAGFKLTNVPVIATDANQAFFRFSADDGDVNWQCVSSSGGVDTVQDSGVPVVQGRYRLRVVIDRFRVPHFYIAFAAIGDRFGPLLKVAAGPAVAADVHFRPFAGVQQLAAVITPEVTIRRLMCSRLLL